jgi:SAM-dependent methyltransferase
MAVGLAGWNGRILEGAAVGSESVAPEIYNRADVAFWDDEHFSDVSLPARPRLEFAFERCFADALVRHAPVKRGARVLEVGCTPARWLVFYAERFGADVEGVDYSEHGVELSRRNLELSGVQGTIHRADFFEFEPRPFELVLSFGFIEHFDDLGTVFRRHLAFVGAGGRLVVGVPNFRGLNRILQQQADPAYLRLHNLDAMEPSLYRRLADENGIALEHLGHLGGFDPVLIKNDRFGVGAIMRLEAMYRRLPGTDRINHPLLSSYLLAVFRRPV